MKIQYITPVYKKGDKSAPENYRPISLTSHIIKIFERVIRKKMVEYLEENNILNEAQHGFRKGRSCLSQLLEHYDFILNHLLHREEVDVIYLDYAKAFDKVDHTILLAKLRNIGIENNVYHWISDFLQNRQQTVLVKDNCHNSKKSYYSTVKSGVVQGSVIGPLLFLIFINDLSKGITETRLISFADDTKMVRNIRNAESVKSLQIHLNQIVHNSINENMTLHEGKFQLLSYRNKHQNQDLPFANEYLTYSTPNGIELKPEKQVRDLGIIMTDDARWSSHIAEMSENAKRMASWVLGAFSSRDKTTMMTLYTTMVRSKMEFCCPLWDPVNIHDIEKLESIQKTFTQKISGCQNLDYYARLKHLNLLSLQRRRERYTLIHTWKILHGNVPNPGLEFYDSGRTGIKIKFPKQPSGPMYAQTLHERSFRVRATKLWNTVPKEIKMAPNLERLKILIGKFLQNIPDEPPVPGYPRSWSNSIIHWHSQPGGQTSI